jgi:outer membrane protein OmpA-like peptidoglycan-associated protein
MKAPSLLGLASFVAPILSPAAAQQGGTFELGAFVQASYFEESLRFERGSGGGGVRLGFFPVRNLELEAEGAFVPTQGPGGIDVSYMPLRAHLLYNLPVGEHGAFLFGGGYVRNEFGRDLDASESGGTGFLGARLGLPGRLVIRLATYIDYIPSPDIALYPAPALEPDHNVNWGIRVGLGFLFGRGAAPPERQEAVRQPRQDSLAMARQDSLARAARADSLRLRAVRDSAAQAARAQQQRLQDSVRRAEQRANELRDSLETAARSDSLRTAALRDSLRTTRNRARAAALRDSLERMALRDSLRLLVAQRETRLTLRGVNFELGKAVLLPISRDILEEVARSLVSNPEVRVEVGGHTDSTGSVALNERLSLARAESVKAFLVENGVAADQMEVRGYASTQPVATNSTASGRAQNRRVELRRID